MKRPIRLRVADWLWRITPGAAYDYAESVERTNIKLYRRVVKLEKDVEFLVKMLAIVAEMEVERRR